MRKRLNTSRRPVKAAAPKMFRRAYSEITMYCQPGVKGIHAGGRRPCNVWAAHKDDEATAAYRCAVKHWFGHRPNFNYTSTELHSVEVLRLGEHVWGARLHLNRLRQGKHVLQRAVQLEIEECCGAAWLIGVQFAPRGGK